MESPYLRFDFRHKPDVGQPVEFTNPVRVLTAAAPDEVQEVFEAVEQALVNGYYAAGFVSYEAASAFRPELETHDAGGFPLVWFALFEAPVAPGMSTFRADGAYHVSDWQMTSSEQDYVNAISAIRQAIKQGTTYQVNYTERLKATFGGDDRAFYAQLLRNQQADYSAYLNTGRYRILSASPELFFRVADGRITAKPMKGTAPRGRTSAEDDRFAGSLRTSQKEQAENLMIVDLLRNDISRLALPGTVHVPKLFEIETYPTVHQLTSTIGAAIRPELSLFDWFTALFPCGSITGAPKASTMHHIASLEQTPRHVYCGAIGYITPNKEAIFSVPIRTVLIDSATGQATYGVGGGITWDSTPEGEYAELTAKAHLLTERRPEFELLESLQLDNGKFPYQTKHLARLADSARYFRFPLDVAHAAVCLAETAEKFPEGVHKVRLLCNKEGKCRAEASPLGKVAAPIRWALAASPVKTTDPFLYHKTTNRTVYEEQMAQAGTDVFSVLLWNERRELTEFTIGNLVIEQEGRLLTPPLASGLLPGVLRQQLLESGDIEEHVLYMADLETAERIWLINSVRGWISAELHHMQEGD